MNFRYKLMQFLSGRYGIDFLFKLIFISAAVVSIINCFVRSPYVQIVVYMLVLYGFFRAMSRNHAARRAENMAVTRVFSKLQNNLNVRRQRRADTTHIYKKCPYCKAVLRLPRRKGKHTTNCPKCLKSFRVRVWREKY